MTDRVLFYGADPVEAYRITRAGRPPGDSPEVEMSVDRDRFPGGTAVGVRVPDHAVRPSGEPGRVVVDRAVVTPDRVGRAFQPWHADVQPDVGLRWTGYLDPVMNLTMQNLVGADNPLDLRVREDDLVAARLVGLAERPVGQSFDLTHLQAIHERLFGDVYPWAGETRTVNMNRPGSPSFCPWDRVEFEVAYLADHLQQRDHLVGMGREQFVDRVARVYDAVNRVHAFREGNGRTQREWMSDLARGAGYRLDWTAVRGSENDQACRRAHQGDRSELTAMIDSITERLPAADTEQQRAQRFAETLRRTRPPASQIGAAPPAPPAGRGPAGVGYQRPDHGLER